MRKRRFFLPHISDLSPEQDDARVLDLEGAYLITGGPGTGKSVVACLRCCRCIAEDVDYVFLVWNRMLYWATRSLVINATREYGYSSVPAIYRWDQWFRALWRRHEITIPLHDPEASSNYRRIDWDEVRNRLPALRARLTGTRELVIIDEGQDFPKEFYESLVLLGYEHFYVLADQNQQITEENSTISEIANNLGLEMSDILRLSHNYRNKGPTARLADHFRIHDHATPPVKPPSPDMTCLMPQRFLYNRSPIDELPHLARLIVRKANEQPDWLIGVLTYRNDTRERFRKALKEALSGLGKDGKSLSIQTYDRSTTVEAHFDQPGVMVLNAQSCKGLEFDLVIIADINDYRPYNNSESAVEHIRRLFYVMVSRSRENVVLLEATNSSCPMSQLLPSEPILTTRELFDGRKATQ